MPEMPELNTFRRWLARAIKLIPEFFGPNALQLTGIWADVKDSEVEDMKLREERLLNYAGTLSMAIVWDRFPEAIKNQISSQYMTWKDFTKAITDLRFGLIRTPVKLGLPWYKQPTAGNLVYDSPSSSQLAVRLTRYMPPTWRGIDPDRRLTANIPPPEDTAWGDSDLSYTRFSSTYDQAHGDVLSPVAPESLARPGTTRNKKSRSKKKVEVKPNATLTAFGFSKRLFPELDEMEELKSFEECGIELTGTVYDPRSIILDLKECFLEIARVPAKDRGYKVVMALQFCTHTLAWLSMDNLCYVYWFSRGDMELSMQYRVPDVLLEYIKWCHYIVEWLKAQDDNPRWDSRSFGEVLSMPGHHPTRAVGRYSLDEIAWRTGIPLWMWWGFIRKNPKLLCAVLETFFLFEFERYCAIDEFLGPSLTLNKKCGDNTEDVNSSYLLITKKEIVMR
ncbi:hypothetical protein R3P38DRAFT_2802847 [Favolaschia claudopus]|uniref:Aminotransferase-like plant mobile domain-containing protein n=1 Tax=Favolaschia claudopus TaxID=2862362 RepID=A0AAV9ZUE3_9AGAR